MKKYKAVIYGIGKVFQYFYKIYDSDKVEIVALCDNNPEKQGRTVQGFQIIPCSQLKKFCYDVIIITAIQSQNIKHQLIEEGGLDRNRIMDFSEVYKSLSSVRNNAWNEYLKDDFMTAMYAQINGCFHREILELERKSVFLNAKSISDTYYNKVISSLEEVEFQVFSQFGEDGIIQWLIKNVNIRNKVFIEFGVENYSESNTRFLLMNNNWTGLVIDGSEENICQISEWDMLWRYDLTAVSAFITKDNINQIITEAGFCGEVGILSVDIDGNDYWVLNAIDCVKPQILICEYNDLFGDEKKLTILYQEDFRKQNSHYSSLYFGASLQAFLDFAEKHDYYYFGSNSAGNNAFFVKKDSINYTKVPVNSGIFIESKYRESRDGDGKLNYLRGKQRLREIKDMELLDLDSGNLSKISEIFNLT